MKINNNSALLERLAAAYVLGNLRGAARRRFETHLAQHASMRRVVAEWQNRLMPLAQFSPSQPVPPHVWQRIERQLGIAPQSSHLSLQRGWQSILASVQFWRNFSIASSAFAAVLLAFMLLQPGAPSVPTASFVAALENEQAKTVAFVTGDSGRGELTVKLLQTPSVSAQQTLQLWAVPKQGNPRSLGLVAVAANGSLTLPMPANLTPQNTPLLAISLEPKGGSPNPNGPTGPILYKGAWVQISS